MFTVFAICPQNLEEGLVYRRCSTDACSVNEPLWAKCPERCWTLATVPQFPHL